MRWVLRLITTTVIAVGAGLVALDASSIRARRPNWWSPGPSLTLAAIIAVALCTPLDFFLSYLDRKKTKDRNFIKANIQSIALPTWEWIIHKAPDRLTQRTISLSVWLLPTWRWKYLRPRANDCTKNGRPIRLVSPTLWRAIEYRLFDSEDSCDIAWRPGIGAIGNSWFHRRWKYFDLRTHWGNMDEEMWNQRAANDADVGFNLRFAQYQVLHEKYSSVLVYPIKHHNSRYAEGQILGFITVDTAVGNFFDLNDRKIRNRLKNCANSISMALAGRP